MEVNRYEHITNSVFRGSKFRKTQISILRRFTGPSSVTKFILGSDVVCTSETYLQEKPCFAGAHACFGSEQEKHKHRKNVDSSSDMQDSQDSRALQRIQYCIRRVQLVLQVQQLLEGLSHIHSLGVVHRDIKMANMYLALQCIIMKFTRNCS